MALVGLVRIGVRDAQGRNAEVELRVAPTTFGAATLPTQAVIEAVINAMFGATAPSNAIVRWYEYALRQDAPTAVGGDGSTSLPVAVRTRNDATDQYLITIPGAELDNMVFDFSNPNSVSVSTPMWETLRDALIAIDIRDPEDNDPTADDEVILSATIFNGTRQPLRPR